MSFEARCPQCLFVSRQLGQPTPCLLHVSLACESEAANVATAETDHQPVEDYDEPYAFGELRPTVDRPGPFSLREYVRLQLSARVCTPTHRPSTHLRPAPLKPAPCRADDLESLMTS